VQRGLPIQVIAHIDACGRLKPLRFQYEDRQRCKHTAYVREVASFKEIPFVGVEAQTFVCRVREEGMERVYELKYAFRQHQWTLLRRLS
jgi:hypothetical protein